MPVRQIAFIALAVTIALIWMQWTLEEPPTVRSVGNGFLAARAIKDLHGLLDGAPPHPTGTQGNEIVRERLETLLHGLGYTPEEQDEYACSEGGICAEVKNVVVRVPGQQQDDAVLLDAHYDSVAAGTGAADNGSGVAIAIEIARLLKVSPAPRRPVIVLFDDGEEQELLGAHAFVDHNPLAREVAWAVNLDARGVRGPSMMYETSSANVGLIRLYARNSTRPVANSLMFDLYRQLPSDTNFTVFREHGWQGFNLAFLGGTQFYHRAADIVRNTDARSVQHQGEEALALVRALAEAPPGRRVADSAVYFDLFSHVFWWPARWSIYGSVLAAVLLISGLLRVRPQLLPGSVSWSLAALPLTLVAAGIVACGALWLCLPDALMPMLFVAYPAPLAAAFIALGAAVAIALYRALWSRMSLENFAAGQSIGWLLIAVLVSLSLVGGSYLWLLPALALVAMLHWTARRASLLRSSVLVPAFAIAGVLWVPLLRLLYDTAGVLVFPLMTVATALLLLLLLPLLQESRRWMYPGSLLLLLAAIASAAVGTGLPRYTESSPFPLNLSYVQTDSGKAYWIAACRERNRWRVRSLIETAQLRPVGHPEALLPWEDANFPLLSAPAPQTAMAEPELRIVSRITSQGRVTVTARIHAAPGTDRSVLYIAPGVKLYSISIEGRPIPVDTAAAPHWRQYQTTLAGESYGVGVSLVFDSSGSDEIYLADLSYKLPAEATPLLNARPGEAMASQDGNTSLVFRRIKL
jgi:hypothetical protein